MQLNSFIILILLCTIKSSYCAPTDPSQDVDKKLQTVDAMSERKKVDYYEWRNRVAEGVQKALDECREKFKWDRWNCPKKAFLDILDSFPLPSNKELGYTRALIAASIVLSLTRSCSYGTNNVCGCSNTASLASHTATLENPPTQFIWRGCDEEVKFGFKVSKIYLESQDIQQDEASRRIDTHNYEVGRIAIKKNMKKICKCHGISGSCQVNTCWTSVPDLSKVGEYLKRQYRLAAKVGATTAEETDIVALNKELTAIGTDKLVFADASPDYCYENTKLGINGTLGRYCSKAKHRADGSEVSRNERDSCDRLCTKCGYKIKRERLNTEKQCDCRFVYCCSVECKRCPHVEDTFRCVRHS